MIETAQDGEHGTEQHSIIENLSRRFRPAFLQITGSI
jgi:hypothetical protein